MDEHTSSVFDKSYYSEHMIISQVNQSKIKFKLTNPLRIENQTIHLVGGASRHVILTAKRNIK